MSTSANPSSMIPRTRRVVGCMTGTSVDAIDAALVEIAGEGLGMHATFVRGATHELGPLQPRLRALANQTPMPAGAIAAIMHDFATLHTTAIRELLRGEPCDLICVHGQTVYHHPPISWQMMQPAPVAAALGVPIVFDLRQADLALGGQGAPITPLADWVLLGDQPLHRAIVNLGGFCNITLLPPAINAPPAARMRGIQARDVCVCNQLLDSVARAVLDAPFDRDGAAAMRGTLHAEALAALATLLEHQSAQGRSLGTGDELAAWITTWRTRTTPHALAATACTAIAGAITKAVGACDQLVLAGGGVHNRALVRALAEQTSASVVTSDTLSIPAAYREAICFAILGALCEDRVPITLPQVTQLPAGIDAPIAGAWVYPPHAV